MTSSMNLPALDQQLMKEETANQYVYIFTCMTYFDYDDTVAFGFVSKSLQSFLPIDPFESPARSECQWIYNIYRILITKLLPVMVLL